MTLIIIFLLMVNTEIFADDLLIATTANFQQPMKVLIKEFYNKHKITANAVYASSGILYHQALHGASFDIFLSADIRRPRSLEEKGLIVVGSRRTYAIGRLALVLSNKIQLDRNRPANGKIFRLAIANPKLAPYGLASMEYLQNVGSLPFINSRIVYAGNVTQSWQYFKTRNVDAAIVAWPTIKKMIPMKGRVYYLIPDHLHKPITQQAVMLKPAGKEAELFYRFLFGKHGRMTIRQFGYTLNE